MHLSYVTKMWQMTLFIYHNCGKHKNTVGHRCVIDSPFPVCKNLEDFASEDEKPDADNAKKA